MSREANKSDLSTPPHTHTQDLLELKMKLMGIKVKILAQEAVEFMQLDPMHKVEDIIRDLGGRVLPDRCARQV